MAELTKQALQVQNSTSFPNNNAGLITPTSLRTFNSDMIDSLVDEISYTADSASFNSRINNITGSATNTGSLLLTASFNNGTRNLTFTKGDATQFSVNIPDVSGSTGNFVTTSSFNAYTASTDSSISQLNASSASQQTSINALNTTTASLNTSASLALVTASFNTGTRNLTFTKGDTTQFSVNIPDISGSTGNFATTGSNTFIGNQTISGSLFQSGSLVQNGTTELSGNVNITGSTRIKGTTTFENSSTTITGSLLISGSTTQVGNNLLTGNTTLSGSIFVSGNISITNGANLITHNVKAAGSNGLDILANNGATIATMGQGGGTQANFVGSLSSNQFSASTINGLGDPLTFSSSVAGQFANIAAQSASWGGGSINTGSFATTGSNVFVGNQTIQKTNGRLLFQSQSVISYVGQDASGNLELAANSTQVALLAQSLATIQTPLNINGNVTALGDNRSFIAAANTAGSGSQYPGFTAVVSSAEVPTDIFGGFNVNNSAGATLTAHVVNSYTAQYGGTPTPVILAAGNNPGGNDTAIGWPSNGQADHWKKSNFKYGIEVTGSTNIQSLTASLANGYVWVGDSTGKTTTVATSSFAGGVPAGTATTGSNVFRGDQTISGSVYVSGSINLFSDGANGFAYSGKALFLTNSVQTGITVESPIHFYQVGKGNFYIQNNVAGVGSGSINITAANGAALNISSSNFANNAGGLYQLGTSPQITLAANTNNSGSQYPGFTALIDTTAYPTDIFGGYQINRPSDLVNGTTFFGVVATSYSPQYGATTTPMIIANGNNPAGSDTSIAWPSNGQADHWKKSNFKYGVDVTGSLVTSGSFVLTGSAAGNVVSASITSNTASIDFSKGNYFEVTSSVTPLHLNVTNIKPGTTSTLIVSASASSSITFSPNVAQPSGNAYSGSAGSIDILSLVSFNTSKVNVVSTKALI